MFELRHWNPHYADSRCADDNRQLKDEASSRRFFTDIEGADSPCAEVT
jgi:hypothetical protein